MRKTGSNGRRPPSVEELRSPLDEDREDDGTMVVTGRCLARLALVACQTSSRFGWDDDAAMEWLLTPRRLFDGLAAIEACLDIEHCAAALLHHGLGCGSDDGVDTLDVLHGAAEAANGKVPAAAGPLRCRTVPIAGTLRASFEATGAAAFEGVVA